MDDPQPALHQTEKLVTAPQRRVVGFFEQTGIAQGFQRLPGVGGPQGWSIAAVFQLEELDEELHVHDAAKTPFQIALTVAGFQALAPLASIAARRRLSSASSTSCHG